MLVKIPDHNLVRDTRNMALISIDKKAKEEYYAQVRRAKMAKDDINKVNERIDSLQSDLNEIKDLLKQLITK